jgi:hypothetical protein
MPRPLKHPPRSLLELAARQEGLLTTAQCETAGMDGWWLGRMLAQARWVRVTSGVYDTDPVPVDDRDRPDRFDHRRRRAAWIGMLAYGPLAVAVGQSALALHAVQGLPVHVRPEVVAPNATARRARDGIVVRQYSDVPTTPFGDRRIATVLHALAQAVPTLDRRHAVAVLDSAVRLGKISRANVETAHDLARGHRGVELTHDWWCLVDGRAESPLETFARLECVDAGVPPDDLQREFFGPAGDFLGRADLAWRLPDGRWLVLEVDGVEVHESPDALFHDRARQNRLVADGGVLLLRTTAKELNVPGKVGDQMAAQLRRHGWTPRDELARTA